MDSLFILKGLNQGRSFKLNYPVTTIGRDQHNDIVVSDREVSRFHTEIVLENARFIVHDLNSSNGVFVNGRKVLDSIQIVKGDRIQIGQTLLLFSTISPGLPDIPGANPHSSSRVVVSDQEHSRIVHTVKQDEGERLFRHAVSDLPDNTTGSDLRMYLDLIYTMTRLVNETLDIETLLNSILDLIFERFDIDRGCILLLPADDQSFVPAASRSRHSIAHRETITISRTILEYVRQKGEGVLTTDARSDERWESADSILRSNIREAICVPMKGRYGFVGLIYIDTTRSPLAASATDESDSNASIHDEDQGSSVVDLFAPDDSARHPVTQAKPAVPAVLTSRLKSDHLKLMAAVGHQAALAVEETRFHAAMLRTERLAAIGQTVAVVSHHVKNILQGMEGGSYMIEQGLKNHNEELFGKGWEMINRNRGKISDLVLDMLSFSKERQPQFALANLNQTVNDIVELMKGRCFNRKINILVYGLSDLPAFRFDQGQIHRALTNLVTNAVDAVQSKLLEWNERMAGVCDPGTDEPQVSSGSKAEYTGRIEVRIQAPSGTNAFVTITVDDNGPGIPQEIANNLFDPFVTCNKSGGTGLGLAVTNKIIQEHHGRLRVERSVLGGARFIVELPFIIDAQVESESRLSSDHDLSDRDSLPALNTTTETELPPAQEPPRHSEDHPKTNGE